jgi:O-acetylhomoserine/O-acetylserine sulfhydrylase-like pyridoxal-dependent enzyme
MPISQAMCSSFKEQLFLGEHDMDTDTIKLALYTSAATLDASTTVYTTSNEVSSSGTNYTAGGNTLTGATVSLSGTTAFVDFSDTSWLTATITARGALVYNSSKSNKAIAVLDFGSDKTSTNGTFTVQMPANTASDALIRIA